MKRVLIVGQKISTLINYLDSHRWEYVVLKDVKRTKFPDRRFKKRVLCDFSSKESVLATVGAIDYKFNAVIATYENYILPAAWIAEYLDLPGISPASAEACTDKFIMRSLFAKAPEKISPDFAIVNNKSDVENFAKNHSFPLILKPANLAKSLLVTKNSSLDELLSNHQKTADSIHDIYRKYAPDRTPQLLIEEFMEGTIHSVDAFVDSSGTPQVLEHVVDYQTGYDVGFEDNFHYSRVLPSSLTHDQIESIRHCAEVGIRALGMKNSPAHVEIILTTDGPRIVEIGARNGGYRERMHNLANGIDITGAALSLALGKSPTISSDKNEHCAVLELFPKVNGTFVKIKNLDKLQELKSLQTLSVKSKSGEKVGKASDGFKTPLIIILHSKSQKIIQSDLAYIKENVEIITE